MAFKLVRTDSEEPCKIQLPIGTHLIGRGKFLDCDDKRVSRKHGELEVTGDGMSIKALHSNPCFYMKKGTDETQILKLNCTVNLSHGDKFGLLPDLYWYELLHCSELDVRWSPERNEENTEPLEFQSVETDSINNGLENTTDDKALLTCDMNETVSESPSLIPHQDREGNETTSTLQGSESPSVIPHLATEGSLIPKENSHITQPIKTETTDDLSPTQVLTPNNTNQSIPSSPKRCHSPENSKDEVKKIKTEPADDAVKQEPDARPGPSNDTSDQRGNFQLNNNNNAGAPPSPVKPAAAPGRERCLYGANCYRRNPQHKAQFSHPQDSDWGAGDRGVCPYGSACMKRDPRHWQTHTHPPNTAPPPPQPLPLPAQKRKRTPKRKSSDSENSDDDDKPESSLVVTGKRARKTVIRPGYSGSDYDDDDDDPFGTDDEEDWEPGSQSQYTQDTPND